MIDNILWPLKVAVAWIMVQVHSGLTFVGVDPDSGLSWALSIVGLVIVMRIILIPLFVRQIRAARGMQMLSPDLQALQKKYKGKQDPASREAMSREMMELYRKHGTNPFASCLPLLAQSPIFFALFRVLYNMPALAQEPGTEGAYPKDSIGPLTRELAGRFTEARLFGARLSDWFFMPDATSQTRVVTVVLIVLMSATTFFTQKQLTQKNMPASALQGPMAQQQKMLMYLLPLIFAVSGVNFPIGVLIYWTTTNVWSMGQQFYVIRRNPTPGSEAERRLKERRRRKALARGVVLEEEPAEPEKPRGQRQQPVRKKRARPRPEGDTGAPGGPREPGSRAPREPGSRRPGGAADGKPREARKTGERPADAGTRKPGTAAPNGAERTDGSTADSARRPTRAEIEARRRRKQQRAAEASRGQTDGDDGGADAPAVPEK